MYQAIKKFFYFAVAWYFRLFAQIKLKRWDPRIIVITGSSGKTTLLHLVESQLGNRAKYSHHANSAIGIPFDILDLHRITLTIWEWPALFIKAPFMAISPVPEEKIYIVEADCDRPYEGNFLSSLLKPEVTLWVSLSRTHSMNFEHLLENKRFNEVENAIAYEFGFFVEKTKKLVVINGDNEYEVAEAKRTNVNVEEIRTTSDLKKYEIDENGTTFVFNDLKVTFTYLIPKEIGVAILMCKRLVEYLGKPFDGTFSKFNLPPARSSVFKGIKNITIVDSTYNANLDSMKAILDMYSEISSNHKWAVLGDMLEQGRFEEEEHKKLAELINKYKFEKIILMGPRVGKYTTSLLKQKAATFQNPVEVLEYVRKNIVGGEIILFKGSRFLEGVIESLLANKEDAVKLSRREKVWQIRRKQWGL